MPELIGYWGGLAATGACYEQEVTLDDGTYLVTAFSSAAGGIRKQQNTLYMGDSGLDAVRALFAQAEKKRKGRERSYVFAMPGTPNSGQQTSPLPYPTWPPEPHPQLWWSGQPLDTLPSILHSRTQNASPTTATAVVPNAAAQQPRVGVQRQPLSAQGASAQPVLGELAGCVNAELADADRYVGNPQWMATRKIEGRRATLYRSVNGVEMTNRAQEQTPLPAAIETAAMGLPIGTRLDGELVAMDEQGREAAFVGMAATLAQSAVFVAFDLLVRDGADVSGSLQIVRFESLIEIVNAVGNPHIRLVEWALGRDAKQAMLDEAKAKAWEGLVFRKLDSPYVGGKSGPWVRLKLRKKTVDLVVVGYQNGTGSNAHRVGSVVVALYDEMGQLIPVGEVGGGWTNQERDVLKEKWQAGETMFVITATCEGLFAPNSKFPRGALIRPSAVEIREGGDKQPWECTFASEFPNVAAPQA